MDPNSFFRFFFILFAHCRPSSTPRRICLQATTLGNVQSRLFICWHLRARQVLRAHPLKKVLCSSPMFIPPNSKCYYCMGLLSRLDDEIICNKIRSLKPVFVHPVVFPTPRTPLWERRRWGLAARVTTWLWLCMNECISITKLREKHTSQMCICGS